jgi:hypothetical protein
LTGEGKCDAEKLNDALVYKNYADEVGKSLLQGVKQERNCSEDESRYTEKVTEPEVT